jgi:BirA family biotin operon repressor/biotin-[acetyl-CoA-carboxylase] ligase
MRSSCVTTMALQEAWAAQPDAVPCDCQAVASTGSTNADLLARARAQAPAQAWLRAADAQSAGRGRLGRSWITAPGDALLFSVARALPRQAALAPLTLACGVALAECLEASGVAVRLKWPNDVLFQGRKLAGILAELALDVRGTRSVVVGVGVNLVLGSAQRARIAQPVAALAEALPEKTLRAERAAWIARLGSALLGALAQFDVAGFAPFHARYERVLAWRGETVGIDDHGGETTRGELLGIDGLGRLRVRTAAGERVFFSGELSVRAAAPA